MLIASPTGEEFSIENKLADKLDLMVTRMNGTDDNVVVVDGDEGQGKTNLVAGICYYISSKTNRKYNIDNIFFDLDEMIKFASETKEQIIHWDEGALGGLSIQWWKKNQIKFIQLLMVARKKKHFIIICIPKFYKLAEYIIVDRSIALIHVYSRQNIHKGRFFYYTKHKKERLYDEWKRNHKRNYMAFRSFGGAFREYMKLIFTDDEIKQYDDKKDKAILSIGAEESRDRKADKYKEQRDKLIKIIKDKFGLSNLKMENFFKEYNLGISHSSISDILGNISIENTPPEAISPPILIKG